LARGDQWQAIGLGRSSDWEQFRRPLEEEGLAASKNVASMSINKLRQIQDASFEGNIIDRHPGHVHDIMGGRGY
jgi:hypothetical protein